MSSGSFNCVYGEGVQEVRPQSPGRPTETSYKITDGCNLGRRLCGWRGY